MEILALTILRAELYVNTQHTMKEIHEKEREMDRRKKEQEERQKEATEANRIEAINQVVMLLKP